MLKYSRISLNLMKRKDSHEAVNGFTECDISQNACFATHCLNCFTGHPYIPLWKSLQLIRKIVASCSILGALLVGSDTLEAHLSHAASFLPGSIRSAIRMQCFRCVPHVYRYENGLHCWQASARKSMRI